MLEVNDNIKTIKHVVLYEVAKLAFEGTLQEEKEELPYKLIPGPQANFRCCIYKEREIIRQRVRLAEGKSPSANRDNKNIVQVINSACEGCPIARYIVTDNCQKCMSKKCQQACNFGAISMTKDRAYIDPAKCKECGKCSEACPYNAIADLMRPCKRSCPVNAISMDENKIVKIDEEKCISCGSCIKDCPFGAISDRSFIVDVINLMKQGKEVYAIVAPAIEGQFGPTASIGKLTNALKDLGFAGLYEASIGADLVADSESKEWAEAYKEGKKMTTSCCPAFVNMIKKHYPTLVDNISTTVSPMTATSKLVKSIHKDSIAVFIGPCIAKKGEVLDTVSLHGADYALTFDELYAMLEAKNIDVESYDNEIQQGSIYGKRFATSGGVTAAVVQAFKENNEEIAPKVHTCSGGDECKKALLLLKAGRLPEDFIEGMACSGGCFNGPGSILTGKNADANRKKLLDAADDRTITQVYQNYDCENIHLHRK